MTAYIPTKLVVTHLTRRPLACHAARSSRSPSLLWPSSWSRSTTSSSRRRCRASAATSAPRSRTWSGRSTPTRSRSRSSCSPAPRWATASGGAGCSSSASRCSPARRRFAALAPSTNALIAARAIQGLGGAIVAPLTLTLLSAAFPADKRGLALGIWSGIGGLAVAMGPLVGGAIIESISWQWIFWVNVPVGIALLPIARRGLVESFGPANRLDLPGVGLATAGLLGVVYATVRGQLARVGEHDRDRLLRHRRRAARRLRPVGAPRAGADAAAALLPLARLRGHLGRLAGDVVRDLRLDLPAGPVLPDRVGLQPARGRPAHAALDRHADARRPDRRRDVRPHRLAAADGRRPRPAGGRDRVAGAITSVDVPYIELVPAFVLGGTGMALVFSPVANAILGAVQPHEAGQASGANNAIRELGGVLGVAVLAAVFSASGGYQSGQAFVDGLQPALWVGAAVLAAGARRGAAGARAGAARRSGSRPRRPCRSRPETHPREALRVGRTAKVGIWSRRASRIATICDLRRSTRALRRGSAVVCGASPMRISRPISPRRCSRRHRRGALLPRGRRGAACVAVRQRAQPGVG